MKKFAQLPINERKLFFEQTAAQVGLPARSVEKDFWVSWTLLQLFEHSSLSAHLTFKGGTSLSKVWKLIQRFSEDIDLIISKEYLGFEGFDDSFNEKSKKQQKKALEELKQRCSSVVTISLLEELKAICSPLLPKDEIWKLEVDSHDKDQQTLLFLYPTCWPGEAGAYLSPAVKIEMGARSDNSPSEAHEIISYVAEVFPQAFEQPSACVQVLAARRTYWEKATLLHEETYRPEQKQRKLRMARHYYDIWCLIDGGIAEEATQDIELLHSVVTHRKLFFSYGWMDYETMKRGSLRVVPLPHQVDAWQKDYEQMQREMFFGNVPDFGDILKKIKEWEDRFNT